MKVMSPTTAYNAIILHQYPTELINKYGIEYLFTFAPANVPLNFKDLLTFGKTYIKLINSTNSLDNLPAPLFFIIIQDYMRFQAEIFHELTSLIKIFSDTSESKHLWNILKATSPEYVFGSNCIPFDSLRTYWATLNLNQDDKDKWTDIKQIFDALQPWLNHELYSKVKENSETRRENWLYDDEEQDRILQEKAAQMMKERSKKKDTDLDEIEIEED